ncbi:retrovirus-related pol polyprotein from transposon TNT 1-94 [Tanacetum coccineum]
MSLTFQPHSPRERPGVGHNHVIHIRGGTLVESSRSSESLIGVKCNTCGSTGHSPTDHNDFDHFKRETHQGIWYLDSGCSKSMTGVKSYLHKYVKQPGPKVVFGDNSSCITERYGSINCGGVVFTKVAFVNGLKYNLISISQLCDAKYIVEFDDKFTNTLVDEIGIDDSSRHPPDEFLQEDDPSRQYQDRWSREQDIELVNIVGDLGKGMLTRSMAAKLTAASPGKCLFTDFLSEIEPKKVSKALKHPGWIEAMQEELNQFYRNKVWTLVPLPNGKIAIGSKWEEGIDYDETFAPVARMEAIRIFLTFTTYVNFKVHQMDVKSAFLNGNMKEEVYVKQPPGFESSEFPDYFEKLMTKKFEMSMIGELTYFLGLQIKQDDKVISIYQEQYTSNLLKKYEISDSSLVKTPMVPPNNLGHDLAGKPVFRIS